MIEPKTETVELFSRLGKVGSIQAFNPWDSRKSVAHAKEWVARVASISYGNQEAANPEKLFQSIADRGHLSCLEFVPVLMEGELSCGASLPANSLRQLPGLMHHESVWGEGAMDRERETEPASAFLVSCPLYTRSQWMRHRSFSYLEMSRRYTKGSKVAWEFYGHGVGERDEGGTPRATEFQRAAVAEYQRRIDSGMPQELARGCIPMEALTTFWCAGFDRDWREFIRLRSDAHAQPEIRVYSDWIRYYLDSKETK